MVTVNCRGEGRVSNSCSSQLLEQVGDYWRWFARWHSCRITHCTAALPLPDCQLLLLDMTSYF